MSTILIVDDHPVNREYLLALLNHGGHRLLEASDGAEALATARAERPDLVIADILMPTMDGFELVHRLREDTRLEQIPVIFFTAHYHEREARALAGTCGVSSVITKPAEPETVLKAVQAALGLAWTPGPHPAPEEFDREHMRLLTDKLHEKADQLSATNERLSALIDLNLQIASELDLQRLLRNFGHAAREIIGARYSITAVLDENGTRFQSVCTSGMNAERAAQLGSPDPRNRLLSPVLREGVCVRLKNPDGDPRSFGFASSNAGFVSWLGAPIASPNRIFGYIALVNRIGREEFSEEDEQLARILAAQVGRVYQNGHLYSEVLAHASELEREVAARAQTEKALLERERQALLAGEVGVSLTRSDTLGGMLQLCAEALVRHLDLAVARIWSLNEAEEVLELEASAGPAAYQIGGSGRRIRMGESEAGRIAQERAPRITNDLLGDPRIANREWVAREGLVAFAGYPLVVQQRLLGVIEVLSREPLNKATVDAVASVADEVALGVERSRSNQILREREEHIRLLLDSTAEAIYGVDPERRCTFANVACARLLGYASPEHLLGKNMHGLIHHTRKDGTPYPADECRIFRGLEEQQVFHVDDEVFWRADGSSFAAEYWSHPIKREGQVLGSVVTFLDITERKLLEDRFHEAQQRLSEVVVSSPAVLFTLAVSGDQIENLTWVSDNLPEVLGYPPEAAIGSDWWRSNVHPDDSETVQAQTSAELVTRGVTELEYRFRHADGGYRWTRCDLRLIRDESGQAKEAVGAWLDITEKKHAEEEQRKLREQLEQAQKLESIGRLAGGVAHDFNNLLTVINGYSDLTLKRLKEGDPIREEISEIRKAGEHAAKLTRQLLLVSRKQVAQTSQLNVNDVIGEIEKMLARVIGEDILLEFVPDPALGLILADPAQLQQVIMNLAVNARDAMPGGGKLLIETRNTDLDESYAEQHAEVEPGSYVQVTVSDTGIGMTPDVLAHVFEPFFTTKQPGEGTGLGLATVYGIVKQSSGSIWVYSEPGQGTTFSIYFPRIEVTANPRQETKARALSLRGTETILVVEDQEQLRKMTAKVLRGFGYRVLEAANPGEALLHAERYAGQIHLLLTDVVMPGMTGPELVERLRPLRPDLEVTFMSGYSERVIADRMKLSGSYLAKPFSPDALGAKVREVLGPAREAGRFLVVDPEPGVRKLLHNVLSGLGYRVIEAANGKEAIQHVVESAVEIAIVDMTASVSEGIETIQALRRIRPAIQVVATSSQLAESLREGSERLGAQAFLAKPVRPDDLLAAVARVTRG